MSAKKAAKKKTPTEKSKIALVKTPDMDKSTAQKMKARAQELHKGILSRQVQNRRGPLEDGWDAAEMKRGNLWVYLGYDDETEYRKGVGIGRSTWFRYRRLAEGLGKLPKSEFLKLRAENADHLIKLPENRRYDKDLVRKAQTLNEEEFEKCVIKFKAHHDRVDEGEVIVTVKWRMPESRREVILRTMRKFAKEHELSMDDESRVLELMCAEISHSKPVVTKMGYAAQDLGRAIELLDNKDSQYSLDESVAKAREVVSQVVRGIYDAAGLKPPTPKPGNGKAVGVGA